MSVVEAAERDALALELCASVDLLTLDGKEPLGDGRQGATLPVLAAVDDARTARDALGGSTPLAQRSPIRLGAVELLAEVDAVVGTGRRDRCGAVRGWSAALISTGTLDDVAAGVDWCRRWLGMARNMLGAPRTLRLRGAVCPACGNRDVLEDGSAGEVVIRPTLVADLDRGSVACAAADCGELWPVDALEHLAAMLDRQDRETLAIE